MGSQFDGTHRILKMIQGIAEQLRWRDRGRLYSSLRMGLRMSLVVSVSAKAEAVVELPLLPLGSFQHYVAAFNQLDRETASNHIPNAMAWGWMTRNVPLFECPDKDLEEIYYFRWWSYRKHIKKTPDGFVVTEFLPQVGWSKKYNTINCPVGHHLYEGRWMAAKSGQWEVFETSFKSTKDYANAFTELHPSGHQC